MAIFIPFDVSPQEMRDCLHEELAQALGPVNDIYRLTNSIFNDDNVHSVLTGFDMLILRAVYHPELQSGMYKGQVATRLPDILARLNPQGGFSNLAPPIRSAHAWRREVSTALAVNLSERRRRAAAERAMYIAQGFAPDDPRRAYSHYVLARVMTKNNPSLALSSYLEAARIYASRPETELHEAHVAVKIAAFQLSSDRPEVAIAMVNQRLPVMRRSQNAADLTLLLLIKAEALQVQGRVAEANGVQREALAWARYGYDDEGEIAERVSEVLTISPRFRAGAPT